MIETIYRYESLHDYIDAANKTPQDKRDASTNSDYSFTGTHNLEEALVIARNGYEVDAIDAKLEAIKTNFKHEQTIVYDVVGAMPDIPEYLSGNPSNMFSVVNEEGETKYAHLVIDINEAWGVTNKQYLNRMAAICSIVNNLEVDGYRVKLSVMFVTNYDRKGRVGVRINVKEYEHSLGIAEIAGVLHMSFLRRIDFLWSEGRSWNPRGDYGSVTGERVIKSFVKQELEDEEVFYLPAMCTLRGDHSDVWEKCNEFNDEEGAQAYSKYMEENIRNHELHID